MPKPDVLTKVQFEEWLNELLEAPLGPIFTYHELQRADERYVSHDDAFKVLNGGVITFGPEWSKKHQSWQANISRKIAGVDYRLTVAISEELPNVYRVIVITAVAEG